MCACVCLSLSLSIFRIGCRVISFRLLEFCVFLSARVLLVYVRAIVGIMISSIIIHIRYNYPVYAHPQESTFVI
jgi:hypothetical protein